MEPSQVDELTRAYRLVAVHEHTALMRRLLCIVGIHRWAQMRNPDGELCTELPLREYTVTPGRDRGDPEQPGPQDPRREDPRRSPCPATTLDPTSACCNDPLNLRFNHRSAVGGGLDTADLWLLNRLRPTACWVAGARVPLRAAMVIASAVRY